MGCLKLWQAEKVQAIIAIGVLIKGDTMHFEYISEAVSQGLMKIQLEQSVPIIYGVLNCQNRAQAELRARKDSKLACSWAEAALLMAHQ